MQAVTQWMEKACDPKEVHKGNQRCETCVVSGGGRSSGSRGAPAGVAGSTGRSAMMLCKRGDVCLMATTPYRSNGPLDRTNRIFFFTGQIQKTTAL